MKISTVVMGGGIMVAGIAVIMATHHQPRVTTTATPHGAVHHKPHTLVKKSIATEPRITTKPTTTPTVASIAPSSASRIVVPAILNQSGTPLWQVKDPQNPAIDWAFAPMGVPETIHNAGLTYPSDVLWFGERTAHHKTWTWTPIALPGKIPTTLPTPVYDTLAWAYDLHAGEPGPHLISGTTGNWNTLTGKMSEPEGWQATAYTTPTGVYTVSITPWMASTDLPHVYFGLPTRWTAHNVTTGHGALSLILHALGPLSTITQPFTP